MFKKRNLLFLSLLILGVFLITGCWLISTPTYTVTYDGNGHTGGSLPTDSTVYKENDTVTLLDKGDLVKTGYTFAGWNTQADGSGTDHTVGSTFTIGASDVTLYAQWTINTYTVTFNKNDDAATGTMAAQTIVSGSSANLTACAFSKTGWTFAGWATTSDGTVTYADEASYIMGTANVILYAKWTPPTTYSLRDIGPAGGFVFYDKGSYSGDPSWRYLETTPSDQSTGTEWGCYGVLISSADGTAVGTGEQNTIDIEAGCATAGIAADICANLSLGGYSDWFLPSKDELNQMYVNLKVAGVGGFESDYYWSSSEFDVSLAWDQPFGTGTYIISSKNINYRVRAIRAF